MTKTTQLVLPLKSRPGVLAKVCRTLADARVNIVAICAPEARGTTRVRMVVSDPTRAARVLTKAGYRVQKERALLVRLTNKPGALGRVAAKLAGARKNIKSCYASTAGQRAAVVLTLS
ncbi:MAG: hypothetical protein A3F92_03305 [Candidatus Rokubacteria bacterium RIFCSPLOWO2_12_FULL_71_22]|nr:amino acid-binding protein [Candidatus Rokubacteria bacterium]OGL08932.1 MAG: hypothetical protein A3I17_05160 [Candidatus Rokubacteria bacterium RIFCSPLOWO2_02_FULL_72_37]OGL19867.1 MAG: hypothetical protein A3F92_03305 [Candidatus Rokubacteria bacterium RIFCSPLOWO2_12_FULL_71_22]